MRGLFATLEDPLGIHLLCDLPPPTTLLRLVPDAPYIGSVIPFFFSVRKGLKILEWFPSVFSLAADSLLI